MSSTLNTQIGGGHYKNMVIQPVEFAVKAELNFIQGCIVKYVSRYKSKNGKQDIEKAIHFAKLAIELNQQGDEFLSNLGLAYTYCKANRFSQAQTNIIVSVVKEDYYGVIRYCTQLIKQEYPLT
jgi:hypothetical protein|nr:MAG TPA: nucelotide kinase [Caudoviricetes sp.]